MTLEMKFKERERKAVATATLAAREEGVQQGMQQGTHARNVEIARNLRNMNMQASDIAKATGLTLAEIEALGPESLTVHSLAIKRAADLNQE